MKSRDTKITCVVPSRYGIFSWVALAHQGLPAFCLLLSRWLFADTSQACTLAHSDGLQDSSNKLTTIASARFEGECGLSIALDGTPDAFVEDATPGTVFPDVTEYTARFYLYVGDMAFGPGDRIELFSGYNSLSELLFSLSLSEEDGYLHTHLLVINDAGIQIDTAGNGMLLKPGWRSIEVKWRAASADGAFDGSMTVAVDGVPASGAAIISGFDNDTQGLHFVRLGVLGGNQPSITGVMDLDLFESGRAGTFGPVAKPCVGVDVDLRDVTFLPLTAVCRADNSIQVGPRATVDEGADVRLAAPNVAVSGMRVTRGATLRIGPPVPP